MKHDIFEAAFIAYRRFFDSFGTLQYWSSLVDATNLAIDSIQTEDRTNGNAYIMLSELKYQSAVAYRINIEAYKRYLSQSAALIYYWKTKLVETTQSEWIAQGNKVYDFISHMVDEEFSAQGGSKYMTDLYNQYFQAALTKEK